MGDHPEFGGEDDFLAATRDRGLGEFPLQLQLEGTSNTSQL
jgi:hypothetical protein